MIFTYWGSRGAFRGQGSRGECYPFYYVLVFESSTGAYLRSLSHSLPWKRSTRPGDYLFRVDRDELWGYRGVRGQLELFRVEPEASSVTPVGAGRPLQLPRYTMSNTPLARGERGKVSAAALVVVLLFYCWRCCCCSCCQS